MTDPREPVTWPEFFHAGEAAIEEAINRVAYDARRSWLETLEKALPALPEDDSDDYFLRLSVIARIKRLRRKLGIEQPAKEVRAQTRERVRQYREHKRPA